jgi:hypothetical protein
MNLTEVLVIANFVFLLLSIIGGYMVVRSTIAKGEAMVQIRVREALTAENDLLQARVKRVEGDFRQCKALMSLLIVTMKKQLGIDIELDDDTVIIRDGKFTRIVRLSDEETA